MSCAIVVGDAFPSTSGLLQGMLIVSNMAGIAQSFVYTQLPDQSASTMAAVDVRTPDFCCPCGSFMGWKQIRLGGRRMSRSYSDLRMLGRSASRGWAWDTTTTPGNPTTEEAEKSASVKAKSPFEALPVEVLGKRNIILPVSVKYECEYDANMTLQYK